MTLTRRNNNWLTNISNDFFDNEWLPRMNTTAPNVNVKENDKAYTMEVAVPGLKKNFCRVSLDEDGNLKIKIEDKFEHKEEESKGKKEHYLRREFNYSNYEQSYTLPEDVDKEKISAKVNNGILTIELPKIYQEGEKNTEHQIEIG